MKYACRWSILVIFLIFFSNESWAQQDDTLQNITSRDTIRWVYRIKDKLIPGYQKLLNNLPKLKEEYEPYEIANLIKRQIEALFSNTEVRVQNDIKPGSDTVSVHMDSKVGDYLADFEQNLVNSDSHSVRFENITFSSLKYSTETGFYFEVYFDCIMKAEHKYEKGAYSPSYGRRMVVEARKDEKNQPEVFIRQITFQEKLEDDSNNIVRNIEQVSYSIEDKFEDPAEKERERKIRQKRNDRDDEIDRGDRKADDNDYNAAINHFDSALKYQNELIGLDDYENPRRNEIKQKQQAVKIKRDEKARVNNTIDSLKKQAAREFKRFNFEKSKAICDTLQYAFKANDQQIDSLRNQLQEVIRDLVPLINAGQNAAKTKRKSDRKSDRKAYKAQFDGFKNTRSFRRSYGGLNNNLAKAIASEAWYIHALYQYRSTLGYEMLEDSIGINKLKRKYARKYPLQKKVPINLSQLGVNHRNKRMKANKQALVSLNKALAYSKEFAADIHPRALYTKAALELELGLSEKKSSMVYDATRDYETLIQSQLLDPNEKADCHVLLGDLYLTQNDDLKALKNFSDAVLKTSSTDFPSPSPYTRKANLEYRMERWKDCVQTCDSGVARLPQNAELYFIKGCALNQMNRQEEAGDCFKKAGQRELKKVLKDSITRISRGYLDEGKNHELASKFDDAINYFNAAFFIDCNKEALLLRARLKFALNLPDQAKADLDTLLKLDSSFKGAHLVKGQLLMKANKREAAIEQFNNELKVDSACLPAYIHRARCFEQANDFRMAIIDYEKALAMKPVDSVWGQLVHCYFLNGDYRKAAVLAQNRFKRASKNYSVHFYAGRSRFALGDVKGACSEYESARILDPSNSDLHWYRGLAFEKSGMWEDALAAFEACKKSPQWRDTAIYKTGIVLLRRKTPDFRRACANLEDYLRLQGEHPSCEAMAWNAFALWKCDEKRKASEILDRKKNGCKDVPAALYVQAVIDVSEGRVTDAIYKLGQAIRQDSQLKALARTESAFRLLARQSEYRQLVE